MNAKKIVSLSNILGIVSIFLLIYWVFTFITMEVFGLKVFRENMTQTFYLSILGILALMLGALILNIMFNLTRIAQKHNADIQEENKQNRIMLLVFLMSFPMIIFLLFMGDYLTTKKKEQMLIESARSIVTSNQQNIERMTNYAFSKEWILETTDLLAFLSKIDKNYTSISALTLENIHDTPVFLIFESYFYRDTKDEKPLNKMDFIFETDLTQREYLMRTFTQKETKEYFHSHDGTYELFYPIVKDGKTIILYFQDRQRYGKLGS